MNLWHVCAASGKKMMKHTGLEAAASSGACGCDQRCRLCRIPLDCARERLSCRERELKKGMCWRSPLVDNVPALCPVRLVWLDQAHAHALHQYQKYLAPIQDRMFLCILITSVDVPAPQEGKQWRENWVEIGVMGLFGRDYSHSWPEALLVILLRHRLDSPKHVLDVRVAVHEHRLRLV